MRSSMNHQRRMNGEDGLFSVDFHEFVEKEQQQSTVELAGEFGLSVRDIKVLKKKLERN
ncbi:hypothetical protein [Bacillus alkalicellulosilyticus]|uniref:hypothetical protein n=1 Tax=Alkalihalobacterium alkalicellulosilyticum TaxID=1912214 RepID=UPI0014838042|nr:hypothetical protein [Bacillus alkalicellulosilyticus]